MHWQVHPRSRLRRPAICIPQSFLTGAPPRPRVRTHCLHFRRIAMTLNHPVRPSKNRIYKVNFHRAWAAVLALGLFLLSGSLQSRAQLNTATMFGTVADSTGAAIPNATLAFTQTQTNFTRQTATNGEGQYRAEFLPVGPYTVKVDSPGFKQLVHTGIELTATQEAALSFTLQPGSETTEVTVTADVPLVNAGNSVLGTTIDNRAVDNLPLVNRDAMQLVNMTPGVQSEQQESSVGFPMYHVLINGSSDNMVGQVSYYLDGGMNMTGVRDTGNVIPNPDALDQFNVQTNNFSAEYGRTGAGVVSVLTKSGTNTVHGSVFYFNQETNFDATSYLQSIKTPLHRNRFGATVGGPVLKDKIFFFGSYAGYREIAPVNFNTVVPDALQRAGNFSENLPTTTPVTGLGACATTLNAADKANSNYGGKFFVCDPVTHKPIAGNRADLDPNFTAELDPVAAAVLKTSVVPLPTNTTTNRYVGNEGLPNVTNEYLIKGDFQLFPKHRTTLAYYQSIGTQVTLPSGSGLPGWALNNYTYRQQTANASDVWTPSSRSGNQIWLSYTRMLAGRISNPGQSLAAYGSDINVQGTPSLADRKSTRLNSSHL